MPRAYAIILRVSNGVWHARSKDFSDLTASGEDGFKLFLDLSEQISARVSDPTAHYSLVVPGAGSEANLNALRLASLRPVIDPRGIARLIHKHGLDRFADRILADIRPAVLIRTTRITRSRFLKRLRMPIGRSRFGGPPDLPRGVPWPTCRGRPLAFLGQLRLSELPEFPKSEAAAFALPRAGQLWFWYDEIEGSWDSEPGDPDGPFRITHVADETTRLERAPVPSALPAHSRPYQPCALELRRVLSTPLPDGAGADFEKCCTLREEVQADAHRGTHMLRGHHDAGNDSTPETVADAEVLLQLSSEDPNPGWGWGDAGTLRFWIRSDDLRHGRIDRAWGAVDSG